MSARVPLKRRKPRADKRGVALVMTLGAITVLTVFLTELQEETAATLSAALADRDALRAEYYARSAVNLARLILAMEPSIRKAIPIPIPGKQLPVWEFTDMLLGPFNDATGAQSFNSMVGADGTTGKNLGLPGGGHYELKIIDEDSKINVNSAAKSIELEEILGKQLIGLFAPPANNPLFEGRDPDNQFSDRQTVCGAIADWVDDDENQYPCDVLSSNNTNASKGSEDNFYQLIGMPYRRKNAPFDSLEELRLVRGVGDDFWSTFVDPDPSDPHKRLMTVWGQNKININTANAQTIATILCANSTMDAESPGCTDLVQAANFLQFLSIVKSFTQGLPILGSVDDFIGIATGKGQIGSMLQTMMGITTPLIKIKSMGQTKLQLGLVSKMFSIYADGVVPGYRRTTRLRIHAVVDFRTAQEIGDAQGLIAGGQQQLQQQPPQGNGTGTAAGGAGNNQSAANLTPAQISQIMSASPAGNIVYWRIE